MILRKLKKTKKTEKKHEKESFNARLKMEHDAQENVSARLKEIEMNLKNIGRI